MAVASMPARFERWPSFSRMQRSAKPRNGAAPRFSDAACLPSSHLDCAPRASRGSYTDAVREASRASEASARFINKKLWHTAPEPVCQAKKKGHTDCSLLALVITIIWMAMKRIIDRTWFESKPADFVRVTATETTSGHTEFTVYRPHVWHESGPCDVDQREYSDAELLAREEAHARRASQSAKKQSRLACKSIGADALMTLTYRDNVEDLSLCKKHLKEFVRRVTRVWPDFQAVCAFEKQKRGALHVHIATKRIPAALQQGAVMVKSFNLLRAIWRSVAAQHGGNVDVQKRRRNSRKSPARIAAYLSKYITKAFEQGEKYSNRWTRYGKIDRPLKVDLGTYADMLDAVQACYSLITDAQSVVTSFIRASGDVFWLAAEPKGKPCSAS